MRGGHESRARDVSSDASTLAQVGIDDLMRRLNRALRFLIANL